MWEYSVSLWKYCNGAVHGQTIEEEKEKKYEHLCGKMATETEYILFEEEQFIVMP